jgi:hypothetical protein
MPVRGQDFDGTIWARDIASEMDRNEKWFVSDTLGIVSATCIFVGFVLRYMKELINSREKKNGR